MSLPWSSLVQGKMPAPLVNGIYVLKQSNGSIAVGGGGAYLNNWWDSYQELIILPQETWDKIQDKIFISPGVTWFDDFVQTLEFVSGSDIDGKEGVAVEAKDKSLTLNVSSQELSERYRLKIQFTDTPPSLTLDFYLGGAGTAPTLGPEVFKSDQITTFEKGWANGTYDGTSKLLTAIIDWEALYGTTITEIKNRSGIGGITIAVTANGGQYATELYSDKLPQQLWTLTEAVANGASSIAATTDGGAVITGFYIHDGKSNYQSLLTKYAADGSREWSKSFDEFSQPNSIATALDGSIYIAGKQYLDVLVSKFSPDGTKEWTDIFGSTNPVNPPQPDIAWSIAADIEGSVFVAGETNGDLEGNKLTGSHYGDVDAFITKYSPEGQKVWTKTFGTSNFDRAFAVTTDQNGAIYVAGETSGSEGLDGQAKIADGTYDAFISKLDRDGKPAWTRLIGSSQSDSANSIDIASDGSVYLSGRGNGSSFLAKFSSTGDLAFLRTLPGEAASIKVSKQNSDRIYIAGSTRTGEPSDPWISSYTPDGLLEWTEIIGSSNREHGTGLAVNGRNIYLAGSVINTAGIFEPTFEGQKISPDGSSFVTLFSSNRLPVAVPVLTGNFKVGQVITIDKTPIQDADNFTGYTPEYKYTWEVSSNGTTWTPLTSADATDNSTTYTLTTTEVGKQVRGVVSYLDGYGTQEVVASAASAAIASSAPPVQSLTLSAPGRTTLRSGTSTTSSIAYNVSTGDTALTGIGASLYFDSSQLTVSPASAPFSTGLIGQNIIPDTSNADGDLKTDKIFSLTYTDFGGNFPGAGTTLPLTLANLNLVPTASYSGTTLHLKANNPSTGFTAAGSDLTLAYNAAPTVDGTIPALTTNRGKAFSYTVPSTLFSDSDSTLTLSASTAAGTALPSWLSFNAATRTISGTPTTGGTLSLNINAADELGSVSAPLTLKVRELQSLSSSTAPLRYQRNKDLTVPINYSTSDGSSSTGLAFKVHYNSSLFSFDPTTGVTNKAQADLFQVGAVQLDTTDSDNDPTTDRYIPINIASFTGQFSSAGAPTKLADLTFRTADKAIDPLTGLRDTSINFSETEAAQGYGFSGSSASLKPLSFSLDVDRDGKVTALGDGLMIIRHLFGSAFAGSALTDKAISPDSPLLGGVAYSSMTPQQKTAVAAQVAANIQEGIDSKALDVDKDNKITALGDGLMVIRRLFGAAFDGAALTSKAISPDSPYFGPPADFTAVAANIDALKPTTTSTPVI